MDGQGGADRSGLDVSYDEFLEWHAAGCPDLQSYFDQLWSDAMQQRRPGSEA